MKKGVRRGLFFGTASGVITTLGLIIGLYAGTDSLIAVIGGIVIIAVSDSLSDAFGIHLAEESQPGASKLGVWLATLTTLVTKFVVALSFVVPLLLFPLATGVLVALLWGVVILTALSVEVARLQQAPVLPVVAEHLGIGLLVMVLSWFAGSSVQYLLA